LTLSRILSVRFGLHSSATDFTATPGTLPFLEPKTAELMPRDRVRYERDLHRDDNMDHAEAIGPKGLDALVIEGEVRGFAANAGGALDPETATEIGLMLDAIAGAASTDPSGAATTTTGGTGSTPNVTVDSGTNVANGVGLLFQTDGDPVIREVVSGGGTGTLVLDRDYSGTVTNGGTLCRSAYWTFLPATSRHTHGYIRAEGEDWRRDYNGCMSGLTLSGEDGQPVMYRTSWQPTSWADTAEANPSFTAPSAGALVSCVNAGLWVGDDKLLIKGFELDFGHTIVPRSTMNGTDGVHGYLVTRKSPVLRCRLYHGTAGLSFGEVADSTGNLSINKIQGITSSADAALSVGQVASTYDIALQVGNFATGALYVRMPAATLRGRVVNDNGLEMIELECRARRPSSGAPVRLHLF
jgi:hypothetical protein